MMKADRVTFVLNLPSKVEIVIDVEKMNLSMPTTEHVLEAMAQAVADTLGSSAFVYGEPSGRYTVSPKPLREASMK